MDLTEELQRRLTALEATGPIEGVRAAVRHIHAAEGHLDRARLSGEQDAFNDVIYRSNQAFEGMLKEAYTVLSGKDGTKLSPYEIEKSLLKEHRFTSRVLALFTNYRQEWRNPATHDHRLRFNEQEALLSIVSVSAFAVVLFDQITEATSANKARLDLDERRAEFAPLLQGYDELEFIDQIISLLSAFAIDLAKRDEQDLTTEAAVLGRLVGFITTIDPGLELTREPLFDEVRPDVLLRKKGHSVLLEVERSNTAGIASSAAIDQMFAYLNIARLNYGVILVPPGTLGPALKKVEISSGKRRTVIVLAPNLSGL